VFTGADDSRIVIAGDAGALDSGYGEGIGGQRAAPTTVELVACMHRLHGRVG